jgi:hypothetical protein
LAFLSKLVLLIGNFARASVVYGYWHEAMALGGAALLSHLALSCFADGSGPSLQSAAATSARVASEAAHSGSRTSARIQPITSSAYFTGNGAILPAKPKQTRNDAAAIRRMAV